MGHHSPHLEHIQRRYMLQLLERPAYQRAFGAGTAEQLMTIVTLGEMDAKI